MEPIKQTNHCQSCSNHGGYHHGKDRNRSSRTEQKVEERSKNRKELSAEELEQVAGGMVIISTAVPKSQVVKAHNSNNIVRKIKKPYPDDAVQLQTEHFRELHHL